MDLLVLGGTSFAGRHVVEQALAAGHAVTTFTRGRTNPGLFPEVRSLHGDRTNGDYASLEGVGPFNAVVDMCAYVPRAVREAIGAIGSGALNGPYILISSVSAYAEPQAHGEGRSGFVEDSALATLPEGIDPASEDVTGETYGPLKVLTERAAEAMLESPDVVWVPWEFLEANGVQPWTDLPAWVPAPMAGVLLADGSKAAAAGLHNRSIDDVVADLAAWDRTRSQEPLRAGMTRERQAELLRKFAAAGPPPGP